MSPNNFWDPNASLAGPENAPASADVLFELDDYDDGIQHNAAGYGGVFNLEFAPDGKLLAAACQNKAVVLFDPLTHRQTAAVPAAHTDCVNGIKFLDSRLFASCSDDHTVALWDVRQLRNRVHTLRGHTKWVKNIEYHTADQRLITSGFDGNVIAWDINRPCDDSVHQEHLFKLHGLMRMKLSPDLNKLVLCTSNGVMLLLQNLDLDHFCHDMTAFSLKTGFVLSGRRKEERSVMGRSRNRPVIIRDFPTFNKAQIIHSMQIHPQSWAVLSRNTSASDESEWTCVHDIQEFALHDGPPDEESSRASKQNSEAKAVDALQGTLPSSPERMGMEDEEELPSQGYYILGDAATPRFEVLLDHRGGNWLDIPSVRRSGPRRRQEDEQREEEEEEYDDEEEEQQQRRQHQEEEDEEDNRSLFEDDSDEFDIDDLAVENNRQRAIMMGLNILIQRNAASVYGDLRTLEDGDGFEEEVRERRRRGNRLRPSPAAPTASSFRERMERQRQLNRSRWRVTRRLSQLTRTYRERRQQALARLAATLDNNNSAPDVYSEGGSSSSSGGVGVREPNNGQDGRTWNERTDEIRQTLRSLRSGLDMVMANLNNVRRQIDHSVESGLNFSGTSPFLLRDGIRTTPTFHENYRSENANLRQVYAQQRPRLTHYTLEPNVGAGFIKELCFSSDGRLICSPFKQGVRLLAFDHNCSEMSHCVSEQPQKLVVLSRLPSCHRKSVVSTRFSPTHLMLVSGCLDGKIAWHQPVL
ncbi:WD40 repeat [Trinorchestia longiramus]|nr:WD40 repeat [Trinorchestia longiramus]